MMLSYKSRQFSLGILTCFVLTACQSTSTPTLLPTSAPTLAPVNPTSTPLLASTATNAPVPTSPPTIPASTVELGGAELLPGFSISRFADVSRPAAFAFDQQGRLYVTSADTSTVYLLQDIDQDGRADSKTVFAAGYYMPLGITVHPATGAVYVSHQGGITVLADTDSDGKADTNRVLVNNLPTERHQNDNLKFGPDGWLYMGLGSTCDACVEYDPRSASILRFNIDTGESEIFATGLRNPYDLAFHPITGELFATDNGRDDLGLDLPSEELNRIVPGGNYGFPNCWNEQNQPGCAGSIAAVAFFESHSSADGLDFYKGERFPEEFRGNAFVSIFGSWLKPNVQTGIKRVILTPENGTYTGDVSWFVRFPEGVMPLPLLVGPDGALYVGDYINDVIYRISYGVP